MFDEVVLLEASAKAAGLDASLVSDDELFDGVAAVERARVLLDAAEAHLLGEIDARGASDVVFGMVTAPWLAREAGLSRRAAKARLTVGRALRNALTVTDEALMAGRISFDHAEVLAHAAGHARVGELMVERQAMLIDAAQGTIFERWRSEVRAVIDLLDADGPEPDEVERNQASMSETMDGVLHLSATLVGEHALAVSQTIDAKTDVLFRWYVEQHKICPDIEVPSRKALRALAIDEICRDAGAVDINSSKPPRPEMRFVVGADDPTTAFDPRGVPLADGTTRVLCCDPEIQAIIVDGFGVPLDMGRHTRWATQAQRDAIAARDGGCVFPGCDAPLAWLDIHHLTGWANGGHSDLDNLAGGCRRHHRVWHRKGWSMQITADGWTWFQSPSGMTFWGQRHGHQRPGPAPPPVHEHEHTRGHAGSH
jgi:hypothetical protein